MGKISAMRVARVSRGLGQADVAKIIEKSVGCYSDKERGEVSFSLDESLRIALSLELTYKEFNDIFFGSKLPFGNQNVE